MTENEILKQVSRFNELLGKQKDFIETSDFVERKNITLMRLWTTEACHNKRVEIIFRRTNAQNHSKTETITRDY